MQETDEGAPAEGPPAPKPTDAGPDPWNGPLWRAIPLAIGAVVAGFSGLKALSVLVVLSMAADPPEGASAVEVERAELAVRMALLSLPVFLAGTAVGVGVIRGQRWARVACVVVGVLLLALQVQAANQHQVPSYEAAFAGMVGFLAVLPRINPWFDPEERPALHVPQNRLCAASIGWLVGLLSFHPMIMKFEEIFASMGVSLPVITRALLDLTQFAGAWFFVVWPVCLAAPVLLLRVPAERARLLAWVVHALGLLGALLTLLAIFLPIRELQRALGQ